MNVILSVDHGLTIGLGLIKEERGRLTRLAYGSVRAKRDRTRSIRADIDARLAETTGRLDEQVLVYSPDRDGIEEFRFNRQKRARRFRRVKRVLRRLRQTLQAVL